MSRILASALAFVGIGLVAMPSAAADERSDGLVLGVAKVAAHALVLAADVPRAAEPEPEAPVAEIPGDAPAEAIVVEEVLALDVIRHPNSDAGIRHPVVVDDPATPAVENDPSQPPGAPVVGPGLTIVDGQPPMVLSPGAIDPGDGTPIIYNPGVYTSCVDATGECTTYGG